MKQDGRTVIGARCTTDGCEWGPLGTDDPTTWDIVERYRLDHEDETGHTVTVEAVRQRTILADRFAMRDATLDLAEEQNARIRWICPECKRDAEELEATKRCPDCGDPFREVVP